MAGHEGVQYGDYYLHSAEEAAAEYARTGVRLPYRASAMDDEFGTRDPLAVTALDLDPQFGGGAAGKIHRATGHRVLMSYPDIW